MARIILPYTPRPHFLPFHTRDQRFSSLVCHRRMGKTFAVINDMIAKAIRQQKPNGRYGYIAPTYKQAKKIAWTYLKQGAEGIATEMRESELEVRLVNGAWISLYGADNPDALRGLYFDGVVMDEYGDCRPNLWGEVVRATLADRKGWAVFIGTYKGKNHFYQINELAKKNPDTWYQLTAKASETNILDKEELLSMQQLLSEEQYAQEMECDPNAAVQGTYYAATIAQLELKGHMPPDLPYQKEIPVQVYFDIGRSDSTAIWFIQERFDGIAVIDYYETNGKGLDHYFDVLDRKPYRYAYMELPHDARALTLAAKKSVLMQFIDHFGQQMIRIGRKLSIMDGIESVRRILPHCHFDRTKCFDGIEALRAYKRDWDEIKQTFRDTPRHDWASNGADSFRYMAQSVKFKGPMLDAPQKRIQVDEFTPKGYSLNDLHQERDRMMHRNRFIPRRI